MTTEEFSHTLVLPWVEGATKQFVNADHMREAFSLAMASGLNLIFSGPGGHGKSEFLTAAIGAIKDITPYVKSFGQGTSVEELYGGLDIDALNRQGGAEKAAIQYNPELSFLARKIAIFEEFLDGPSRVLTSLKDTLTARALRNGHQHFSMETSVICGATNHSPQDIAEGGPEIAALIERFPIQLEVKWPKYNEESFVELFATVTGDTPSFEKVTWDDIAVLQKQTAKVVLGRAMQLMLARIIVELRADQVFISPRTAVLAMQLVKAAAAINDRDRVIPHDIMAIAFLPGVHSLRSRVTSLVTEHARSIAGEAELDRLEEAFKEAGSLTATTEEDFLGLAQLLDQIRDEATTLMLSTSQGARRQDFLQKIKPVRAKVQESLDDFARAQAREEHERTLAEFEEMILRLRDEFRYGRDQRRADAREGLRNTRSHLAMMKVHSDLEPRRMDLLRKIQLAGV